MYDCFTAMMPVEMTVASVKPSRSVARSTCRAISFVLVPQEENNLGVAVPSECEGRVDSDFSVQTATLFREGNARIGKSKLQTTTWFPRLKASNRYRPCWCCRDDVTRSVG